MIATGTLRSNQVLRGQGVRLMGNILQKYKREIGINDDPNTVDLVQNKRVLSVEAISAIKFENTHTPTPNVNTANVIFMWLFLFFV